MIKLDMHTVDDFLRKLERCYGKAFIILRQTDVYGSSDFSLSHVDFRKYECVLYGGENRSDCMTVDELRRTLEEATKSAGIRVYCRSGLYRYTAIDEDRGQVIIAFGR